METRCRKTYEAPSAEDIGLAQEDVICGTETGFQGRTSYEVTDENPFED